MVDEQKEKDGMMRIPGEFDNWISEIQKEFDKKRGFIPSKNDVLRNIVKQFKGQFIV